MRPKMLKLASLTLKTYIVYVVVFFASKGYLYKNIFHRLQMQSKFEFHLAAC